MYIYKRKGKQQIVLLLLLFLQAISSEAWAQDIGDGTFLRPWKGKIGTQIIYEGQTCYIDGVTDGRISCNSTNTSSMTLVVRGTNKLYANDECAAVDASFCAYQQNHRLTIKTNDSSAELEVHGGYTSTTNHAGIGMYNSTVIIDGNIKVTAHEAGYTNNDFEKGRSPGIGGAAIRAKYHPAGTLTLKNGARVYTEAKSTNIQDQQLPTIIVENYATISSNSNRTLNKINGKNITFDYNGFNGTKPSSWSTIKFGDFTGGTGTIYMDSPYDKLYVNDERYNQSYYQINSDVSGPLSSNKVKMGFFCDEGGVCYSVVSGTYYNSSLSLNVNKYPISGILTAGTNIIFSGNNNQNPSRTLYTKDEGLSFVASGSNSFQLTNLTCATGYKIKIDGQIYMGAGNNWGVSVAQDKSNTAIYHRVTTLQNNTRVNKVTYGGVDIPNYYQPPGSNQLYLWLPNVSTKELRIETVEKMVYTNKSTISMTTSHSTDANDLLVIPTEFNVNASTISLNAATSGNQTVLYDSKSYSSPINTPITVIGTTDKNSIILEGSGTANLVLKGATISTTANGVSPLQSNNITANITVNGVNALTASSAHALSKSGGTLTLQGASASDQLTVASNSPSHKDIYTLDRALIIKSSFNLRSQNRTVSPLVTIQDTPLIQFQQAGNWLTFSHTYMLASDIGNNTVLKTVKYKNGTEVSPDLYTANALVGQFYLWMPQSSEYMYITAGSLTYVLPSQATSHNKKLNVFAIPASIGDVYYDTLEEAFAAAVEGNTIKLRANCALTTNGTATLSKLAAGKAVTLQNDTYTLTSTSGYTLAAGSGTLKLDFSGSGKMAGPFTLSGSVYTTSAVANLGAFTRSGIGTVYRQLISSLPTNTPAGQSLMCQAGTTTAYPAWNEGGQTCLWVPAGQQTTTIKDAAEPISTVTTSLTAHGGTTPIATWPVLNIQYGDIDVNGSSVTFGSKRYVQSVTGLSGANRFRITGTSTTKKVTTAGTTFIDLNALTITAPSGTSAFTVNGGAADITVTGTNSLTGAANNHGIHVATGTLNLSGTGTLTTSGPGTGQDINNLGTMTISGTPTLVAANSRFRPTAVISAGKPTIKLGATVHYRASLPVAGVGTISNLRYADNKAVVDPYLYTPQIGDKYYFWMPADSRKILLDGTVPVAGSVFILSSRNFTVHNADLTVSAAAAGIGAEIYATLSEAFAAATAGQTIALKSSYTMATTENAALGTLKAGQVATLQVGNYTLKGVGNCMLSAGAGVLKLDISGSGALSGPYALQGYVYSSSPAAQLNAATFTLGGVSPVYRTLVNGLPTQLDGPLAIQLTGGAELPAWYDKTNGNACLWLPAGQAAGLTISDVLASSKEPVASLTTNVTGNSAIFAGARPLANVEFGDVLVATAGSNTTVVTYGKKRYNVTLTDITSANRLPIYGTTTKNQIVTSGTDIARLSLRNVNIQMEDGKEALKIGAPTDIELYQNNALYGGKTNIPALAFPAVQINSGTLTLNNDKTAGTGQLAIYGGRVGPVAAPALDAAASGQLTVAGGTLLARHGDEAKQAEAIKVEVPQITGGSVDALFSKRPKNGVTDVFKVAVTTGLDPGQMYNFQYKGKTTTMNFQVMPDNDGKIYCWLPSQLLSDEKTKVTLTHPVSFAPKEIEIVKVDPDDDNVAPIVLEMTTAGSQPGSFGNLKDAFDAMEEGKAGQPAAYHLKLLTGIGNLRTLQRVPSYTEATLDLGSFEIGAQNGTEVAFDASDNGAFLRITGKGNIKNTFRISGDVFIDGVVPLTDAVVELNKKAVFRTLVKDLPAGKENSYTYSYGQQQNVPFNLHDGLACLWLPDYGRSEELRFTVSTSGSSTEYTSGNITTVTQRTEPIPANPVGVVARLIYKDTEQETNQAFNTLQDAFNAARRATAEGKRSIMVTLLTGASVSEILHLEGVFTFNLDGKSLSSVSGGKLEVADRSRIVVADQTAGTKGSLQTDVELMGDAQLFIPGSIQMKGNVKRGDLFLWRTLLNMSYMPAAITEVTYKFTPILLATYPVIAREVCLWLEANDQKTTEYKFIVGGKEETVTGYLIAAHHNNDMAMGSSLDEARIGTRTHSTLAVAFTQAENDDTIELLKSIQLESEITTHRQLKLEVGKYSVDSAMTPKPVCPIRITSGGQLTLESRTSTGQLRTPLILDGGLLYAGQSMNGNNIQVVQRTDGSKLYRLLVTNLPTAIPTGKYNFTYGEGSEAVNGEFLVKGNIACLWLPQSAPRKLTFTVAGGAYDTENVMINADHFNTETYGVSDVAQIQNGNKYPSLHEAFRNASGSKTIRLLKNAALTENVSITGTITLETGSYSITAQSLGSSSAAFTVPATSNLQITGKGNITANFSINPASASAGNGNGNLQVDEGVGLNSNIQMEGNPVQRTIVKGVQSGIQTVKYIYGSESDEQSGTVQTAADGTICLWIRRLNTIPQNFFVETPIQTYLATSVVITEAHNNPVTVKSVTAEAGIGDNTYSTLADAFDAVADGQEILLRKNSSSLSDALTLPDAVTTTVVLKLDKKTITASGATFDANKGHLVLTNGSLAGTFALTENVYAGGDVMMNNATVSKDNKTVWRTLVTLPAGTTSFTYKIGTDPAVPAITSTNIQLVDGKPVACLWLPSSGVAQSFTVQADNKVYALNNVIVASTHGNELDALNNDPVAKIGDIEYASLAAALAVVPEDGKILLMKELSLSSVQAIDKNLTLNLGGFSYTSGNSGFGVTAGKTLTLVNGQLLGTIRMPGEGRVFAGKDIKIAGVVLNSDADEVFRTLVKVTATDTRCLWMKTAEMEYDQAIDADYEVTIPAALGNHNTTLTAYKRIVIKANAVWEAGYANANLVLEKMAMLDVSAAPEGATLHRLTIYDGARVKTTDASGIPTGSQVLATEGIRYIRTFTTVNQWESIALPYTASRIQALLTVKDPEGNDAEKLSVIVPAWGTGTAGHFWLRTVQADGSIQPVNSSEMTANRAYIMAVPMPLAGREITFVSGANQLLRRDKVLAVKPVSGFAAYTSGSLDNYTVPEPCYLLNANGSLFERQGADAVVAPFRGYLLADAATTLATSSVGVSTGLEEVVTASRLKVYSLSGRIILEASHPERVWIYNLNGVLVRCLTVQPGTTTLPIESGFYIVNRTKVIVP